MKTTLFFAEASSIYSHVGDDVQFSWTLNPVPVVADIINIQNPNGKVMFYVSGTVAAPIETPYTGRIVYNGNTVIGQMEFTLKQITRLDAGVYKASKAGAAGSPVYQGPTLFVLGKPTKPFVRELSPPVVNKTLHLNCSTTSTTVPGNHNISLRYTWNIDGVNITSSNGRYLVIGSDGPLTVTFTPSTTSYSITEQGTIPDITCNADCKPSCSYRWTKDGQVTLHGSGSTLSLRIINRNDSGVYRCTSWNGHDGPLTATFTPSTTSYSITEQGTIPDITCTADCYPNCNYRWTKDGQVTSHVSDSILSLRNINRNDTGVYRCTSWNDHGTKDSNNINVDVKCELRRTDEL
ncbi:hypothetical protein KUTeg_011274 [Tegillarca granosa]|uniref:Ig-like domain-containing protein n=1 Tax=Tegillarca granosa TaxID=220873 RepID=A0ABQ9F6E5_TEGGR|nr:hypothetical protein KUTeg_011274 [Tegillarca granosa]